MVDTLQMSGGKSKDNAKYRDQIRRLEEEKEKLITEHGAVLSSMQKRYVEEVTRVKQHERTVSTLMLFY
jgi:diphthamide synthase (EF-2-diphthine--ammonia ligase)